MNVKSFNPIDTTIEESGDSSTAIKTDLRKGIEVKRVFSTKGIHPADQLEWDKRTASIGDDKGNILFQQDNIEVPKD